MAKIAVIVEEEVQEKLNWNVFQKHISALI